MRDSFALSAVCPVLGNLGSLLPSRETPRVFADIDGWVRHRLGRATQTWKRGRVIYRELVACRMPPDGARRVAANSRRWWKPAMALNMARRTYLQTAWSPNFAS